MKVNSIEYAVAALLEQWCIEYRISYVGERTREGWKHDRWNVVFKSDKAEEDFEYSTGLGHRRIEPREERYIRDINRGAHPTRIAKAIEAAKKPEAPPAAGPLYGLILDSSALYMSFYDWCDDFGYDADSRRAEFTFDVCRENARKLRRVFTKEQIDALQEALQDY